MSQNKLPEYFESNGWSVVYTKAIRDDGSLFFPERLTKEFLDKVRRTMGSYIYANQYQNEIIPSDKQVFPRHWLRYYVELPPLVHTFAFIDPAISETESADYTAFVVISVDAEQNIYVRVAKRERCNPSRTIDLMFELYDRYKPQTIGIEDVAFQRSIIHFAMKEMKTRKKRLPIAGIKRAPDKTKHMRIMGLVPRFEWGSLYLAQGLYDLETELSQYPRSAHDDLLDALSSCQDFMSNPVEKLKDENVAPNHPDYERQYIEKLAGKRNRTEQYEDGE